MIKNIWIYLGIALSVILALYYIPKILAHYFSESPPRISEAPAEGTEPPIPPYGPFATTKKIIETDHYLKEGWELYTNKEYDKAIASFNKTLELKPKYALAFSARGFTWEKKGNYENAINDFNNALALKPNKPYHLNNLAWALATCPQMQLRDGERSVKLALKAAELTQKMNGDILDTLAAAYAQSGDFSNAIKTQKEAIKLIEEDSFKRRLELYKQKKTYTDIQTK